MGDTREQQSRIDTPQQTPAEPPGGGLTVPAGVTHYRDVPTIASVPEPIPGERDVTNLTHRDAGAVGGRFSGDETPSPASGSWMDERTARERRKEGGG